VRVLPFSRQLVRQALLPVVAAVAVLVALVLWIGREGESRRRLISWKAATCWSAASNGSRQGRRVNPSSGQHDRVAAAIAPAIDHRGLDADVHSVVLSGRMEDS
jgi:hypothetical protein